ncbi:hypothetical protein R6Z07F_016864 [Ovis aries]
MAATLCVTVHSEAWRPMTFTAHPGDRKKLFNKATVILRNLYWTDVKQLTMLVVLSETLKKQLVDMLNNYFSKELGLEVKQDK